MRNLFTLLFTMLATASFAADAPRPSLVVTAPIQQGVITPTQTYVGTLYYDQQSTLAAETEGAVRAIHMNEGEAVKKEAILIELDDALMQAQLSAKKATVAALQASLTRQERDLERSKALLDRNSISQSGYDQVFYTVEQLRAEILAAQSDRDALQIQINKMQIRAPYDGIITKREVDLGEWVAKGAPVAVIVAPQSIEARVNVPANLIEHVIPGKQFVASIEGQEVDVTVKTVLPVADQSTRSFMVEFSVPSTRKLIEGMRIDINVPTLGETTALIVPRDAVIKRFGQTAVFAVADGKAMMIPVQVIAYETDRAAITGMGLVEGMKVITKGNERVFPNMPVVEKE